MFYYKSFLLTRPPFADITALHILDILSNNFKNLSSGNEFQTWSNFVQRSFALVSNIWSTFLSISSHKSFIRRRFGDCDYENIFLYAISFSRLFKYVLQSLEECFGPLSSWKTNSPWHMRCAEGIALFVIYPVHLLQFNTFYFLQISNFTTSKAPQTITILSPCLIIGTIYCSHSCYTSSVYNQYPHCLIFVLKSPGQSFIFNTQ